MVNRIKNPAAAFVLVPGFLLLTAPACSAQEINASYQFYGFSDDLKYCVFEMYEDGGDMRGAYSIYYFIDVDKNDYAVRPVQYIDSVSDDLSKARTLSRKSADSYFKRFNISGKKLGVELPLRIDSTREDESRFFTVDGRQYMLLLNTVPTGKTIDSWSEVMAIVDLMYHDKKYNLQPPTKAPESWGFIIGYKLLNAFAIGNKLALFIEYNGPGFEGYPDKQQMIVTGILPK